KEVNAADPLFPIRCRGVYVKPDRQCSHVHAHELRKHRECVRITAHAYDNSTQKPQNSQNHVGSGFPPSLRFRLRAERCGVTTTKLEERSRVGEARRSAKRGGSSRIGRNPPKGGRHVSLRVPRVQR